MDRRKFIAAGIGVPFAASASATPAVLAGEGINLPPPLSREPRVRQAFERRQLAAKQSLDVRRKFLPIDASVSRADRFSFSKGFLHNRLLGYDRTLQERLRAAIRTSDMAEIDAVYRSAVPIVNPVSGNSFLEAGRDSRQYELIDPPDLTSSEFAWEAAELCWAALCRDIPFSRYHESDLVGRAYAGLFGIERSNEFAGSVFQPESRPTFSGPYVSQFLLRETRLGGIPQVFRGIFAARDIDYMTDFDAFVRIQNGTRPEKKPVYDASRSFPATGRDLASLIHKDYPAQYFVHAAQQLFELGSSALNEGNPYVGRRN